MRTRERTLKQQEFIQCPPVTPCLFDSDRLVRLQEVTERSVALSTGDRPPATQEVVGHGIARHASERSQSRQLPPTTGATRERRWRVRFLATAGALESRCRASVLDRLGLGTRLGALLAPLA
jgi:hypothetical protein